MCAHNGFAQKQASDPLNISSKGHYHYLVNSNLMASTSIIHTTTGWCIFVGEEQQAMDVMPIITHVLWLHV